VPRITTQPRARILEGLELKAGLTHAYCRAKSQQALAIGRDQVGHLPPFPDMAVKPQSAVHGVNHPVAARSKFTIWRARFGILRRVVGADHTCGASGQGTARLNVRLLAGRDSLNGRRRRSRRYGTVEHHALQRIREGVCSSRYPFANAGRG
jgi:hypothetical protein